MPPLAELAEGMAWGALGLAAAGLCWGCVRFAKSLIAYRRWRAKLEAEQRRQ